MKLPPSLQVEDDDGHRRLVALVYAAVGVPSVACLWILGGFSAAVMVGSVVPVSAVLFLLFVRLPRSWVWIYPLGIAPLLTCLAGAEVSGQPSLFMPLLMGPAGLSGLHDTRRSVVGAWLFCSVGYFVLARAQNDGSWGFGAAAVATVMHLTISLVGYFKAEQHRQAVTAAKDASSEAQSALAVATDAAKTRERFLANMTYELRTPLTGIIGMAQLLPPSAEPEVKEVLDTVSTSASSLLEIVNDLLSFSKGRSGTLELRSAPFAPGAVIRDAVRSLASEAQQKRLELLLDLAPNLPVAMLGDELRFRQVIINLVGNALKFTEEGAVTVRAFLGTTPLSLVGEVADTGLGLTITRQLVELMGGTVEVESEIGRGSVFRFQIPLNPADTRVPLVVVERWLEDRRVALVAPRPGARAFLRRTLENVGATLSEPERLGVLAVELQRLRSAGRPVDVAVVDFPPDGAWHDLAEAAKWVSVLVLVTPQQRAAVAQAEIPRVTLLDKPYSTQELLEALRVIPLGEGAHERHAVERRPGSGLDVLVAEDNAINARVAQGFLARLGHRSVVVPNGLEALRALALRHFDVVLMDMQMPEMDGLEATRRIRAQEAEANLAHLPVFMVSANSLAEDETAGLAAGADAFLSKPIGLARLEAALAELPTAVASEGS